HLSTSPPVFYPTNPPTITSLHPTVHSPIFALVKMVKIAAIVLLMGVLANAAALPVSEPAALVKRGNAGVVAAESGDVPDFNVQLVEPTGEGARGNVTDSIDLTKDIVPETQAASFAADSDAAASSPRSATDRLLYSTSMSAFLTAKRNKDPRSLIW